MGNPTIHILQVNAPGSHGDGDIVGVYTDEREALKRVALSEEYMLTTYLWAEGFRGNYAYAEHKRRNQQDAIWALQHDVTLSN